MLFFSGGDDESSSEGSDYEDDGEEDIDLDADSKDEEEEEEKEEEPTKMPPKRKSKTPPRKPKPAPSVDDLTGSVNNMSLKGSSASMGFVYPHMLYSYAVDNRDHVRVDFLVPTLTQNYFLPRIDKEAPSTLVLTSFVPEFFPSVDRLDQAHGNDQGFNANTHMNTAYKKLANGTKDDFDNDVNRDIVYSGEPQKVELPFACEDDSLAYEIQYFPNDVDELTDALGGMQFHSVLSVIIRAIHKPKQRVAGGIRVVGGAANQQQQGGGNAPMNP